MREKHGRYCPIVGKIDKRDNDLGTVGDEHVLEDSSETGCCGAALNDCSGIIALETDAENVAYVLLGANSRVTPDKEARENNNR